MTQMCSVVQFEMKSAEDMDPIDEELDNIWVGCRHHGGAAVLATGFPQGSQFVARFVGVQYKAQDMRHWLFKVRHSIK